MPVEGRPNEGSLPPSAVELRRDYRAGEYSPVEIIDLLGARLARIEPVVNAFTTLCLDRARDEARAAERAYHAGHPRPLEGIPFAAKDLFDSEGVRTTYGSSMFAEHVPAADARAVKRARDAGGILVGKTSTHEWGWGITTVNPHFGPTRNPWSLDRVPGGSSGGSAAALATHEVPLALGSDTGGSIRIPAAYCGVVGLKPTYGCVPAAGAMALARSLDHPGPMARTPADAALFLSVLAGSNPEDPATEDVPPSVLLDGLEAPVDGLRVGICPDLHTVPLAPDVEAVFDAALKTLEDLGCDLVELALPEAELVWDAFTVIQRAEALFTHRQAGLFPNRRREYGADVLARLELAASVTLTDYLGAAERRCRVRQGFARLFDEAALVVTPVSACSPVAIGEEQTSHFGEQRAFRDLVMPYTVPQDLAGLPAVSVRAGIDASGVPVGIQFTGPWWAEARALGLAQAFFDATGPLQSVWPALSPALYG